RHRRARAGAVGARPRVRGALADGLPVALRQGLHGLRRAGAHPELIAVGTKGSLDQIAGVAHAAIVRPWLQDMNWESPGFGPEYVRQEIKHAEAAGATGWLLWNPGQDYSYAFQVMPKKPKADEAAPAA